MRSKNIEVNMDGELEYIPGTKELYTGSSETHYENGKLRHSGQYENGLMEGIWKYFYEDGQLFMKMTFERGIMNGLTETFYENGTPNLKGYSKNGKREGKWTTYKIIPERICISTCVPFKVFISNRLYEVSACSLNSLFKIYPTVSSVYREVL